MLAPDPTTNIVKLPVTVPGEDGKLRSLINKLEGKETGPIKTEFETMAEYGRAWGGHGPLIHRRSAAQTGSRFHLK